MDFIMKLDNLYGILTFYSASFMK